MIASIDALIGEIRDRADSRARVLVAVAGAPGSGKSTLAETLVKKLGHSAAVLPMDGYHLDNPVLERRGLLERKGAPETFDADAFVALVRSLRTEPVLTYPTFDRGADRTVPNAGRIDESSNIVVIEGNYLLLDSPPWTDLGSLFDLTVYLDVPRKDLEARLIQRWINHGLSESNARTRALGNDMRNVDLVTGTSRTADFIVQMRD
ncbi:phosphoribulokinase [Aliiroseovarius sp. 2305UL8-7]|uniref:phosphoribulokinase n=1 Tax=Aliiroseovarius conchicola TaxID=3121637 RepID=UPI003527FF1F